MVNALAIIFIILVSGSVVYSSPHLESECDKLNSSLSGEDVKCLSFDHSSAHVGEINQLEEVSLPLQEWLWLNNQMKKKIIENKKKEKKLESIEKSFIAAKNNYPNAGADEAHFKKVEQYTGQYEALFQATHSESMLHDAMNLCYGAGGFRCPQSRLDDFKIKYAEAQSKKLAILMNYPLLSNNSIRESVEDEINTFKEYTNGKGKRYSSMTDFTRARKIERRKSFKSVMLEGIDNTKDALDERQLRWRELYTEGNNDALGEINFKLGKRDKGFFEKSFSSYKGNVEDNQTDNAEMISEILSGIDLSKEFSNPYIGKAVCSIHSRNQEQLKIDNRNQMILDTTLMVAPFFLGPAGVAARVATMGRIANWGVKGRIAFAGIVEGGLIGYDRMELSKTADKCDGIKIQLFDTSVKDEKAGISKVEEMKQCQKDLETQILISNAGMALAPLAFMYSKAGTVVGKLSTEGSNILGKFTKVKEKNLLLNKLKAENLSVADTKAIQDDFLAFKKESGLKGDELVGQYKVRFDKKYSAPICKI
jgi:hypothetical protein